MEKTGAVETRDAEDCAILLIGTVVCVCFDGEEILIVFIIRGIIFILFQIFSTPVCY